ncbi:MAG: VWA domain-containing protein [Deltaproteobacteria bacterium]|nr:VWA domain-containing protein [Deltaproteobacteria bacterium]
MSAAGWTFASPAWLLLALALPAIAWLRARRGRPALVVPFASQWSGRELVTRSRLPLWLLNAGVLLLAVALARPQHVDEKQQVQQDGYDIVLAIDLSGSMLAEDYERGGERINRLQAIKPIVDAFIAERPNDRIGLVTFAGRAYTLAPLTADHDWLHRQVERLKVGLIEDGTAIGDGLALALARLGQPGREADGHRLGGFVILLTDGANNAGAVAPLEAAAVARQKGIPVYTIAAGAEGVVPMPVFDERGRKLGYRDMMSDVDEPTLNAIAQETSGRYFRATDSDTVNAAFAAIDRERKIAFDATALRQAEEFYAWAAWPGLALIALAYLFALRPFTRGGRRSVGAGPLPSPVPDYTSSDSASSPAPTEQRPLTSPRVAA